MTDRVSGPAVSWSAVIGMMPSRLTSPTVGLMPTSPFAVPGLRSEPDVSVPMPAAARLAATAMPGPELDTPGVNPSSAIRGSGRGS